MFRPGANFILSLYAAHLIIIIAQATYRLRHIRHHRDGSSNRVDFSTAEKTKVQRKFSWLKILGTRVRTGPFEAIAFPFFQALSSCNGVNGN